MKARVAVAVMLLFGIVTSGCAKQPATVATSTPPPTGRGAMDSAKPGEGIASTARPLDSQAAARDGRSTPATERPAARDFVPLAEVADVYFDFDRYNIRADAAKTVDANARVLRARASSLILIEGHCDERGTSEYNLALGEQRARAARNALLMRGIETQRITVVSYGEGRPQCSGRDESCWAKNRRARFLVKDR